MAAIFVNSTMEVTELSLKGARLIRPKVFGDARGYFLESYNQAAFKLVGIDEHFVQDNQSLSNAGVVRGLHFQVPPHDQGKLVRVIKGAVRDVILDIRKDSPTYGQHLSIDLTEENFHMLWVPPGFAHGFATLADQTIFVYKCTAVYNPAAEGGILWNDPDLAINWGVADPKTSERDKQHPRLRDFNSPF